jgi:hypothetical protein
LAISKTWKYSDLSRTNRCRLLIDTAKASYFRTYGRKSYFIGEEDKTSVCRNAGIVFAQTSNNSEAKKYLERGCEQGDFLSCINLYYLAENTKDQKLILFRAIKPDAGPISGVTHQGMNYSVNKSPANFFDDKTYSQILSPEFWSRVFKSDIKQSDLDKWFFDVKVVNDAVVGKYNVVISSSLKLSGTYLVEEISRGADAGPTGKSNVAVRCDYFIPEYNN